MSEQIVTVVENVSQVIEIDLGSVGPRGPAGDPTTVPDGAIHQAKVAGLTADLAARLTTAQASALISAALSALVSDAPTTLDTLGEIADALAADDGVVEALTTLVGSKADGAATTAALAGKVDKVGAGAGTRALVAGADGTPGSIPLEAAWGSANTIAQRNGLGQVYVGAATLDAMAPQMQQTPRRYKFDPGSTGGVRRYVRLATIDGVATFGGAFVQFLLSGSGDYGSATRGMTFVTFGQRGDNNADVKAWAFGRDTSADPVEFYTRQVSTWMFELWARLSDWNQTHTLTVFADSGTSNGGSVAINVDSATGVPPTFTSGTPWPVLDITTGLAGKRDAATGTAQVYIRNTAGVETTVGYSAQAPTVDTVAMRDGVGALHVAAPTAVTHATNKTYVDTALANKVGKVSSADPYRRLYGVDAAGVQTLYPAAGSALGLSMVLRDAAGSASAADATLPMHLVPKGQMDAALAALAPGVVFAQTEPMVTEPVMWVQTDATGTPVGMWVVAP